jgi:hypothetical protein
MFKINQICFDNEAKELVKLTNFRPAQNDIEKSLAVDLSASDKGMVPFEAIALRVFPPGKSKKNAKPQIAYTYRQVKVECLRPLSETPGTDSFEFFLHGEQTDFEFIGRV